MLPVRFCRRSKKATAHSITLLRTPIRIAHKVNSHPVSDRLSIDPSLCEPIGESAIGRLEVGLRDHLDEVVSHNLTDLQRQGLPQL